MNDRLSFRADSDLLWRAEEACRQAWPAASESVLGGWLLRRSGGKTRRTNSVNPLRGPRSTDTKLIAEIEAYYRRFDQVPIFRVTDFADELSIELDRRNYSVEGETKTLAASLRDAPVTSADGIEMAAAPGVGWLDLRDRLSGDPIIFRDMAAAIRGPTCFASARAEGRTVSIAYGAIHQGMLVLESVVTDPAFRGRGLAKRTLGALLGWARREGAPEACLQVLADNAPAQAVYAALGFRTELYRYRYRFAPNAS